MLKFWWEIQSRFKTSKRTISCENFNKSSFVKKVFIILNIKKKFKKLTCVLQKRDGRIERDNFFESVNFSLKVFSTNFDNP